MGILDEIMRSQQGPLGQQGPFGAQPMSSMQPTFRIPGMDPQMTMLLQSMLEPVIRSLVPQGAQGYAPGLPGSTQNLFSQMQVRRDMQEMEQAMRTGMELDRARWMRALEGQSRVLGTTFNPAAANQLTTDFANTMGMPIARFAPGLYSTINGGQDAATFGREMWMGSRFMVDPVSGMPRMSPMALETAISHSYQGLFGEGADPRAARGMSSYQLGGLYHQFAAAHMGPAAVSRDEAMRVTSAEMRAAGRAGAAGAAGGPMAGMSDMMADVLDRASGVAEGPGAARLHMRLQQFNAQRTRTFLRDMTQSFSQLQDMLTDQGHANASPEELFAVMNALTQGEGGMRNLGAGGMNRLMTSLRGSSSVTGQPIENVLRSMQVARQYTDALGLGNDAASRLGIEAYTAANARGQLYGGAGSMTSAQILHGESARLAAAESSSASMQMAATISLADTFGGGNADVQALRAAIRTGRTTFTNSRGQQQSTAFANDAEWSDFMTRGLGIQGTTVQSVRNDTRSLQRIAGQNNLAGIVYQMQRDDIRPLVQDQFRVALSRNGFTAEQIESLSNQASLSYFGANGINPTQTTNPAAVVDSMRPPGMADAQWAAMRPRLLESVTSGLANVASNVAGPRFGMTGAQLSETYGIPGERAAVRDQQLARYRGLLSASLGGVNRSTFAGTALNILANATPGTQLDRSIAELLNLVPAGEVRNRIEDAMTRIRGHQANFQASEGSPEMQDAILREIEADVRRLTNAVPGDLDSRLESQQRGRLSGAPQRTAANAALAMLGVGPSARLTPQQRGANAAPAMLGVGPSARLTPQQIATDAALSALGVGPGSRPAAADITGGAVAAAPGGGGGLSNGTTITLNGTLTLVGQGPVVVAATGAVNAGSDRVS